MHVLMKHFDSKKPPHYRVNMFPFYEPKWTTEPRTTVGGVHDIGRRVGSFSSDNGSRMELDNTWNVRSRGVFCLILLFLSQILCH